MSDPVTFTSASARYGLPFLFAGQSQKEFTVNEAHALADMLLHPVVEGEADDPPESPAEGECWLIGAAPSGSWTDHAGELACHQAGNWIFATPREGLRVHDRGAGRDMRYLAGWQAAAAVPAPVGGLIVDSQARIAIGQLIDALVTSGILPAGPA
ncbi:conserved hypothetical protein [Altererythrobacter sp. B11]|uniref:DUF2793 domain-containing protein n=1 Tax=Altererythrobacter sp. B11 TaxID=2060312 RepID=UPI000DC72DB2|nr:DUF2793 domain-containing protein [Altererythrobacter sp. B11]BBC71589.1 conserved hypothetical protein [Altererythrobacter sp. B11]